MINTLNDKTKIIKKYHFKEKTVKTILNKRHGPRQLFMEDYSFNIYNGCTFDCSYCYINGSKYAEDTKTYYVKTNANDLLHQQLKNKAKKVKGLYLLLVLHLILTWKLKKNCL